MPEIEEYQILGRDKDELLLGDVVRYTGSATTPTHAHIKGVDVIVTALVPGYSAPVVKVNGAGNVLFWAKDFRLVKGVEDA